MIFFSKACHLKKYNYVLLNHKSKYYNIKVCMICMYILNVKN